MTDLRELMHQTVEHEHADMVRLAARARRQGTTLRRRRRLAVVGSSLAVLAVLGAGVAAVGVLLPGAGDGGGTTAFADQGSATDPVIVPAPLGPVAATDVASNAPDGPASRDDIETDLGLEAGEALEAAVRSVAPGGTISEVSGDLIDGRASSLWVGAGLRFAPADGSPAGLVAVYFRDLAGSAHTAEHFTQCHDDLEDCQVTTLPDDTTGAHPRRRSGPRGWPLGDPGRRAAGRRLCGVGDLLRPTRRRRGRDRPGRLRAIDADQVADVAAQLTPVT